MKGISVIVSAVLLIAITVAVASILNVWILSFSKTQTSEIGSRAEESITCSYGAISLRDLRFQSATSELQGKIVNTGNIKLGDLVLYIIYDNGTLSQNPLCKAGNSIVVCSSSNLTLKPSELALFKLKIGSNYDSVRISTNCTGVYDEVGKGDILS